MQTLPGDGTSPNEAVQLAAALNHPNIAQIYQIDEAVPEGGSSKERRPFIAMEYINGEPLQCGKA